jgi:hypothetical protein
LARELSAVIAVCVAASWQCYSLASASSANTAAPLAALWRCRSLVSGSSANAEASLDASWRHCLSARELAVDNAAHIKALWRQRSSMSASSADAAAALWRHCLSAACANAFSYADAACRRCSPINTLACWCHLLASLATAFDLHSSRLLTLLLRLQRASAAFLLMLQAGKSSLTLLLPRGLGSKPGMEASTAKPQEDDSGCRHLSCMGSTLATSGLLVEDALAMHSLLVFEGSS